MQSLGDRLGRGGERVHRARGLVSPDIELLQDIDEKGRLEPQKKAF